MYIPNEIQLIIISNLKLKHLKEYRLVNRQCNFVCRPKLWEKVILSRDLEALERGIKAAEGFTWRNCGPLITAWMDDRARFLYVPPAVRDLEIQFSSSDVVFESQAMVVTQIASALHLKRFAISRPQFVYWNRHSLGHHVHNSPNNDKYNLAGHQLYSIITPELCSKFDTKIDILFEKDKIPLRGSLGMMDAVAPVNLWPTRVRSYETVVRDGDWRIASPHFVLHHMSNLKTLKIHFISDYLYHDNPNFQLPPSVTEISIVGPLGDSLVPADYTHSAFLQKLPQRLTTLRLNVHMILGADLDNITSLPNLVYLNLITKYFLVDAAEPSIESISNTNRRSNNLRNLRIHIVNPNMQGSHIHSIIRSAPKLRSLSLRWFVPQDISILPQYCPNLKILELYFPHPEHSLGYKHDFRNIFRDTIPRLRDITFVYLTNKRSIYVETLDLLKCAVQCPNLIALSTNQNKPDEPDMPLIDKAKAIRRVKRADKKYQADVKWPREAAFRGHDCFISFATLRKLCTGIPLEELVVDDPKQAEEPTPLRKLRSFE